LPSRVASTRNCRSPPALVLRTASARCAVPGRSSSESGGAPISESKDARAERQADRCWIRPGLVGCLPPARIVGAECLQVVCRPRVAAPGSQCAGTGGQPAPGDRERGARRPATRAVQAGAALLRPLLAGGIPAAGDSGGPAARGMHVTGHIRTAFGYLAAGRGVILALPHMGNYDLAGAWLVAKGAGSVTAVAERLQPESVYDRFVAFREGIGMQVLPASGGRAAHSASWRSGCGPARLSA
jgi:hypothetical protein